MNDHTLVPEDDDDGYRDMPVRETLLRAGCDVRFRADRIAFAEDFVQMKERQKKRIEGAKRRNTALIWAGAAVATAIIQQLVTNVSLHDIGHKLGWFQ